jgi:phage shock protein PspC (stress-responsive transcriptional regulator)
LADRYPAPLDRNVRPRIWRSRSNRVLAGVLGGLAERLDVNATTLRWFVSFAAVMTGFVPAFLIYIIVWSIADVRDVAPRG